MSESGLTGAVALILVGDGFVSARTTRCYVVVADMERELHSASPTSAKSAPWLRRRLLRRASDALTLECVTKVYGVDASRALVSRGVDSGDWHTRRPYFRDLPFDLSVSHSGRFLTVAITDCGRVGIDLQIIRDVEAGVVARACSESESDSMSCSQFHQMWARKEAVLKATGDGLALPMSDIKLEDYGASGFSVSRNSVPIAGTVVDVPVERGYACAVAIIS